MRVEGCNNHNLLPSSKNSNVCGGHLTMIQPADRSILQLIDVINILRAIILKTWHSSSFNKLFKEQLF